MLNHLKPSLGRGATNLPRVKKLNKTRLLVNLQPLLQTSSGWAMTCRNLFFSRFPLPLHLSRVQEWKSTGAAEQFIPPSSYTGQGLKDTGHTQHISPPVSASCSAGFAGAGDMSYPPEQEYRELPEEDASDGEFPGDDASVAEEGEV